MTELVQRTAGLSGSDLKELCRNAAMIPIREFVRSVRPASTSEDASQDLIDLDTSVSFIKGFDTTFLRTSVLIFDTRKSTLVP